VRIAFVSVFPPYRGGISQFNMSLLDALAKNHSVSVFNFKRQYPGILFPGKSQYDSFGPEVGWRVIDSINPSTWSTVAKEINDKKPDSVLMASWHPFVSPCLGSIARKIDSEVVGIIHNVTPHGLGKSLVKYQIDGCDRVIVLNKNETLLGSEYIPFPPYSHFGSLVEKNTALEMFGLTGKKVLLFFGFIKHYKGLDLLLRAMKFLDDSYALIIAGESYSGWGKYRRLIEDVKQSVVVHNYHIPSDTVPFYFSAADVCVLPYRTATQSAVGAVANHYGVPCISTPAVSDSAVSVSEDFTPESIARAIGKHFSHPVPPTRPARITWDEFAKRLYP
jgi:glycosyltransferase involved in cell wall biosynthesis